MKKCKTCETLAWLRQDAKERTSKRRMVETITATVTVNTYTDGILAGRMNIAGGKMRFCPECGRKLRKCETKFVIKQSGGEE